ALEVIPGGFIVIDWESAATTNLYLLDGQGKLMNETNSTIASKFNMTKNATHLGNRITGIRVYNFSGLNEFTYAVLDDTGKNITLLNSSSFARVESDWQLTSFSSTDDLVGFCTNKSDFWVATGNLDVITHFGGGGNNSVNQSEFTIPGPFSTGGIDCINANLSTSIILDDTTGVVHLVSKTAVLESINLSGLLSLGVNTFTDVALLTDPALHRPDFYVLNNNTKLILHINKRTPDVLNIYQPNISYTTPGNQQTFNSRFSTALIQFSFSAIQGGNTRTNFTAADRLNCSLYVNDTLNFSITNTPNNSTFNNSINVSTFSEGVWKTQIRCLANNTYAKEGSSLFKIISRETFRHIVWMNDNFTLYYNSDDNQFEAALGHNATPLTGPFNITVGEDVNLRFTWDNVSRNRTLYVNGIQ
ncbi:hypothetical protein LCGC14_2773590, partial [marine sediment metagenome]